ncbi:MAG: phosphatase PAP2-related protein [Chitinophagales bacterium]|nr:phosphatase PAP2-related protein [Chitinophagales bacterium]
MPQSDTIASQQPNSIKAAWTVALQDKRFLRMTIGTFILVVAMVAFSPSFFSTIEARQGKFWNDPLLDAITPINLAQYIYTLLYISIITILAHLVNYPRAFISGLLAYCLMTCMRLLTVYLVPLEPHPGFLPLSDPFLNFFFYGGQDITKDLFFSGHTATLFIFGLVAKNRKIKWFFYVLTVVLAVMILVQHVHYTYDVLAAPFFALAAVYIVKMLFPKEAEATL